MKKSLFVAAASLLLFGACKGLSDIPSSIPLGFVTITMNDSPGQKLTSPSAYFVDAVNVSIPNSATSADTCAQIPYPGTGTVAQLSQINAGSPITVATTLDTAQLTPTASDTNGYIFYRLPTGDSVRIVPGSTGHLTVPGASNGFSPFDFSFVNADSLKVQPIQSNEDSTLDQTITWNPQLGAGSSFVLELEYGTSPTTVNSQIFCQFTDNGSHAVQASLINLWRTANVKKVHAYRYLTTVDNDGTSEVVVISTYSTDNTTIVP